VRVDTEANTKISVVRVDTVANTKISVVRVDTVANTKISVVRVDNDVYLLSVFGICIYYLYLVSDCTGLHGVSMVNTLHP